MPGNILKNFLLGSIILSVAILPQLSCKKNSLELSDLVGTWEFQNAISQENLKETFDGQMTFTLNSDLTITIPGLNYLNAHGFAFGAETFRMVVHYGFPMTHIICHVLWEGEMTGDGLLSGKMYFSNPSPGNDIMEYEKESEIGGFSARRL